MRKIFALHEMGLDRTSRLLVFMPHPDDEAVFVSGLLQKACKDGVVVRVVTLTSGEKSTLRYGLSEKEDLATTRRKELGNALELLGVMDFNVDVLPDGGLSTCKELAGVIKKEIRTFKPTHVLTLEPDGIYGHPDHISLSLCVTEHVSHPIQLLYATVSPTFIMPSARSMAEKSVIKPIHPDFVLKLTLGESVKKLRAMKAHSSQFRFSIFEAKTFLFFLVNQMLTREFFTVRR